MPRRLSFRDRFFTPRVARAVTSPSAILATGVTAAIGIAALGPFGVLAGLIGYGVRVAVAIPRNPNGREVDPFAVGEPWRGFVSDAVQAQRRFADATRTMRSGPLRDRLHDIGDRLDTGVDEVWRIAQRGQLLATARKQLNPDEARWELQQLVANNPKPAPGSALEQTAQSYQAQIDSAARMDRVIGDTADKLRLMAARLDEMVTRTVELSTAADDSADLGGLGADVDGLVNEMESLRQALEDTGRAGDPQPLPPPTATA